MTAIEYIQKNIEPCNDHCCSLCVTGHAFHIEGKGYHTHEILLHLLEKEIERQGGDA